MTSSYFKTKGINNARSVASDTVIIVMYDYSYSRMGDNYGPPDPPPQMETVTEVKMYQFSSEEDFKEWVQDNEASRFGRIDNWRAFRVAAIAVKTRIEIDLE